MKRSIEGITALLLLLVFCGAADAEKLKLAKVLIFAVPDVPADTDAQTFETSALAQVAQIAKTNQRGWEVNLVRKDRGNHQGRYGVVLTTDAAGAHGELFSIGGRPASSVQYHLVGADKAGPLPDVEVLGIHYLNVIPERSDAFDRFIAAKLHPAVGNLRPDLRLLYYKSDRPGDVRYITIFALTKTSRDKYWPGGSDSDDLKAAFKPLEALAEELKTYLVDGSYATGNLAAAVFESKEWADWVIVQTAR